MLLTDIQAYLNTNSVGAPGSQNSAGVYVGSVFIAHIPSTDDPTNFPTPDPAIGLFQYPGAAPAYTKVGVEVENVRFQVLVASESFETAMSKAMEVYALLSGKAQVLMGANTYRRVAALQVPPSAPPDLDDAGRWRVSTNYEVTL